ncbi:MAG: prepilin-type N-terminal cleavage/methylation domain-containing protein [Lachnospiraceae bacterium]|nr:prepilin-type N-terminal cleavage/methylation domain-containing protein [Lachnospiraceae bacterium]
MKRRHSDNFILNNKGETLVEIMVAFIVLMIVIAAFTGAINAASASVNNSKDIRQRADNDYTALHESLNAENLSHSVGSNSKNPSSPKTFTITGTDGDITLKAYQYESGETVYWVFR